MLLLAENLCMDRIMWLDNDFDAKDLWKHAEK